MAELFPDCEAAPLGATVVPSFCEIALCSLPTAVVSSPLFGKLRRDAFRLRVNQIIPYKMDPGIGGEKPKGEETGPHPGTGAPPSSARDSDVPLAVTGKSSAGFAR